MRRSFAPGLLLMLSLLVSAGCSSLSGSSYVVARDSDFIVMRVGNEDAATLAGRYLGDKDLGWIIEDANYPRPITPGSEIIIPLKIDNPTGFEFDGYQTVPILCYHRFGGRGERLAVSAKQFREQLNHLKQNGYRVIPLTHLLDFLNGKQPLPKRSVVLTIDDGHRSIYRIAFPILKEFGFPATVFIYSDYMNNGGLQDSEIRTMYDSGLISFQPHSKSHSNLTLKKQGESTEKYSKRVYGEVVIPSQKIAKLLGYTPHFYAYPFGDANDQVIDELEANGLLMGLTVQPSSNAAYTYPYLLHRSMIFGDRDMESFIAKLVTFKPRGH